MMIRTHARRLVSAAVLGSLSLATPATAQESMLEFHFAGLDACATSPKDAGAMSAIRMLGDRLADLEQELDMRPEEGELMRLAWDALTGAMSLRVQTSEGEVPIAVALSTRPMDEGAGALRDRIIHMAQMSGLPMEEDDTGGALFGTPMGPASLQVVGDGDAAMTSLTFGDTEPAPLDIPGYGLPAGATPVMSFRADLSMISGMLMPFIEMEDPRLAETINATGWVGPDAPTIEAASGYTDDASLFIARVRNARAAMAASGVDPEVTFLPAHLRAVPGDAVRVVAFPFTFESMLASLDAAGGAEAVEEVSRELGVDVRAQIIDNLGPRMLVYQSDTTGGGGLFSTVLIAQLQDAGAFADAHRAIVSKVNAMAEQEADGYLRIATREQGGAEVFTLTTPGLPVPLELSWAVANGTLIAAASPASLDAALAQMADPAQSILDNPMFQQAVGGMMPDGGASSISYADTPRLARRGYGFASLLASGIANATRSPADPDRVSRSLMPLFNEFAEGIRPSATVSGWDGDDFVTRMVADRSMLVLAAGGLASLAEMQGIIAPAMGAGIAMPALGRARENAQRLKSSTQIRGIMQGVIIYGADNDDTMPESFDVLLDAGIIAHEMLESPFGPASDGGLDIAVWFSLPSERAFSFDARQIMAIDRAMLLERGYETNVGFADNHVETIGVWELEELLDEPQNEGAREALGIPDF